MDANPRWYEVEQLIAGLKASWSAKYLLFFIHLHTNHTKKFAWKSQNNLAAEMAVSPVTVKRAFNECKRLGVVEVRRVRTGKHRDDQYNEYWLVPERLRERQTETSTALIDPCSDEQVSEHGSEQISEHGSEQGSHRPIRVSREGFQEKGCKEGTREKESAVAKAAPAPSRSLEPKPVRSAHDGQANDLVRFIVTTAKTVDSKARFLPKNLTEIGAILRDKQPAPTQEELKPIVRRCIENMDDWDLKKAGEYLSAELDGSIDAERQSKERERQQKEMCERALVEGAKQRANERAELLRKRDEDDAVNA